MNITQAVWNTALIEYEKPVKTFHGTASKEAWDNVYVTFTNGSLKLSTKFPLPNGRSLLLATPTLIELTPWNMIWEAYWWKSGPFKKTKPKNKFLKRI